MTENMKKFLALAKENEELSEKLKNGLTTEELTALAKEQGITLTEEDYSVSEGTPLTDEELDDVAGGFLHQKSPFYQDRFMFDEDEANALAQCGINLCPGVIYRTSDLSQVLGCRENGDVVAKILQKMGITERKD